jgi:hypothetical protein
MGSVSFFVILVQFQAMMFYSPQFYQYVFIGMLVWIHPVYSPRGLSVLSTFWKYFQALSWPSPAQPNQAPKAGIVFWLSISFSNPDLASGCSLLLSEYNPSVALSKRICGAGGVAPVLPKKQKQTNKNGSAIHGRLQLAFVWNALFFPFLTLNWNSNLRGWGGGRS